MTLENMCLAAARYSDRYDEFERTATGDAFPYEDDALHYFNVFRDAINEAYRDVSRLYAAPDTWAVVKVTDDRRVILDGVSPAVYGIKSLQNEEKSAVVPYTFDTKYVLEVDALPGSKLNLFYHYIPEDLTGLSDEPVFTEAQVDPMVYISLAVARIWYSEKKFDYGNQWLSQYYNMLKNIRASLKDRSRRRIPRGVFR